MSSVDRAERRARVILSKVCEPGDPDGCRLVRQHSAVELLERLTLGKAWSGKSKVAEWSERASAVDYSALMVTADAVGARYLCPGDAGWPEGLDDLERMVESADRRGGVPFGLWVRGDADLAPSVRTAVAIVGSRASTAYGDRVAGDLAFDCGSKGFTVVSGGAYGIDAAAHRGALARERCTVAVLAGGIDRLYPAGNSELLRSIARTGLIVSEAAPGCAPSRSRFLVRNRLIAALTRGTVVVEAALRSGSLNTARWARDLGRGVMGVPGPVTSCSSAGVHELLRQPEALLVTDALEVVEHLSDSGEGLAPRKEGPIGARDALDVQTRLVLDAVPIASPAAAASIAVVAGVSRDAAVRRLVDLHTAGLVLRSEQGWVVAGPS